MAPVKNWASADAGPGRNLDDVCLVEWGDAENFRRAKADWLRSIRRVPDIRLANMVWLLVVLGDYMKHRHDVAWPSIDRLAAELAWSRSTVKRALALAIEWGWLIRDRRYNGSNRYAMSYSRSVRAEVDDAHALRMRPFIEGRGPVGSNLSPPLDPVDGDQNACGLQPDPTVGSNLSPPSVQVWPHSGLAPEPLYHRTIPSKDTEDEYQKERLGETEQDESLGELAVSISELHGLLGDGDEALGARRASRLSKGRLAYLAEQIEMEGIVGAASDIQSAIRLALTLESKSKTEVTP